MPEPWMREQVLAEITKASELGQSIERAELQSSLGIGAQDMELVLDRLREDGLIRQEVPGEYDLNPDAETAAAVAAGDLPPVEEAPAPAPAATPRASAPAGTGQVGAEEMRMSRAMIAALDDEGLGRLVKAGIEGAGGEFLLRVVA